MTMLPMYKKCADCAAVYSFNPGVGKMKCPVCGSLNGQMISKEEVKIGDVIKTGIKSKLKKH